jgi:hypothetical protein
MHLCCFDDFLHFALKLFRSLEIRKVFSTDYSEEVAFPVLSPPVVSPASIATGLGAGIALEWTCGSSNCFAAK